MSQGGRPGDLLVRINVTSSPHFRRQGAHLYHDVSIPLQTAVLGGQVRVPTLDGDIHLRVAPGTQPGDDVVLRGRGMPAVMERGKGDLFVSFRVQIPRSVTCSFSSLDTFLPCFACGFLVRGGPASFPIRLQRVAGLKNNNLDSPRGTETPGSYHRCGSSPRPFGFFS